MRTLLPLLFIVTTVIMFGCTSQQNSLSNDVNQLKNQNNELEQRVDSLQNRTDKPTVKKVLVEIDTIVINDSLLVVDSVFRYDTTYVFQYMTTIDSIYQSDSTYLKHHVTNVDSVHSYDTVFVTHNKTKIDSILIKDSLIVKDTVIQKDTVSSTETLYQSNPLEIAWSSPANGMYGAVARRELKGGLMYIEFNNKIDKARTGLSFITITSTNPDIYYDSLDQFTRWVGSNTFQFNVWNYTKIASSITVTVNKNVYDISGNTLAANEVITFNLETSLRFTVTEAKCDYTSKTLVGSAYVDLMDTTRVTIARNSGVYFQTSQAFNAAQYTTNVVTDLPLTVSNYCTMYIQSITTAGDYTFTFKKDFADVNGVTLDKQYVFIVHVQ